MNWNFRPQAVPLALIVLLCLHSTRVVTAATTPASQVLQLKTQLNRLVRQQDVQLNRYEGQLGAATLAELRESVFALSEVFAECTQLWLGLRSQYEAVDAACSSQGPHSPESIAAEATLDFNQCLSEVEAGFLSVTAPIDEAVASHRALSSKLNFWLQSKLFGGPRTASAFPTLTFSSPLDTFDAAGTAQEIFHEAVLWDNVGSIELYRSVKAAMASGGPLTNAGEYGFFCAYNSRNKLFQKLKTTEAFLNTNCSPTAGQNINTHSSHDGTPEMAASQPETVLVLAGSEPL